MPAHDSPESGGDFLDLAGNHPPSRCVCGYFRICNLMRQPCVYSGGPIKQDRGAAQALVDLGRTLRTLRCQIEKLDVTLTVIVERRRIFCCGL